MEPSSSSSCNNPICAQYRIQHKNITLKRLELEKELDQMRRAQSNQFNQAVETRSVTPMRDATTGDMGLMMRNGEVITPDKLAKRMEIAAKCMETLQASEKHNRQLSEENKTLKQTNEVTYNEMRRLERILSGFERTRRFDHFTNDLQRQTVERNEKLAAEVEQLERTVHALQEENAVLKQHHKRQLVCATRARVDDDDENESIVSYITSDGRIPPECPCDAHGCEERYEAQVIGSESPTEAFVLHMSRNHKVVLLFCLFAHENRLTGLIPVHPLQEIHQGLQESTRTVVQPQIHGQDSTEKTQGRRRLGHIKAILTFGMDVAHSFALFQHASGCHAGPPVSKYTCG